MPRISSKDLINQKVNDDLISRGSISRDLTLPREPPANNEQKQSLLPSAQESSPLFNPVPLQKEPPISPAEETKSSTSPDMSEGQPQALRRSTREKVQRKVYDASTGKYVPSS